LCWQGGQRRVREGWAQEGERWGGEEVGIVCGGWDERWFRERWIWSWGDVCVFRSLIGNWDRGGERLDGCGVLRAGSGMISWEGYSQQGLCYG